MVYQTKSILILASFQMRIRHSSVTTIVPGLTLDIHLTLAAAPVRFGAEIQVLEVIVQMVCESYASLNPKVSLPVKKCI